MCYWSGEVFAWDQRSLSWSVNMTGAQKDCHISYWVDFLVSVVTGRWLMVNWVVPWPSCTSCSCISLLCLLTWSIKSSALGPLVPLIKFHYILLLDVFFRHGTSIEFSLATAVTRKVEPTLWYVPVMGILYWIVWWNDHRPLAKYIFQNTRHKSSITTCIFLIRPHAYFLVWRCVAFRRLGLVELQLKLVFVNILVCNLRKYPTCPDYSTTWV